MKKIYIAMAVLATAALTSCEQEKSFNDEKLMDNTLVFSLQGAPSTRSMETGATIEKGVTFELGTDEEGNSFFMEETIQDLNAAWAPATKGTPAYTENVGVLYEKMGVRAGSSNYEFYSMDNSEGTATGKMVDGGWRYQGEFTWAQDAYDFYFWMPTTGNGITGTPTYGTTGDDLSITFTYESPTTAAAQKDLIFAARNITKSEAQGDYRVNGVPVLFNHALTGVKFAIKNYDKTKKITITSVSFSGLYDGGTCTIIPAKENNYRDKPTEEYSSGDGRVSWPATSLTKSGNAIESGEFTFGEDGPINFTGGSFANNGNYPDSFSAAGNENNLNDGDASQTFWLIPQTLTDAVTLTIHYTFGSDEDQTWVIDFGEIVAGKGDAVWKAGQLRTYTLKVDDINVHIADEISSSHIKQNIAITNTGNTDAFIRATIIGNWCAPDGAAVFGFTDFIDNPGEYVEIESWTVDNPGEGSSFNGLPATGWVRGKDGYFYYTTAIAPEATAPALFTSYTPGPAPAYQLAGKPVEAHFVMEIATQAISAKKPDASPYTWSEAWTNALGYNPNPAN